MPHPRRTRSIFITGTDTGVGKTLLTALLLTHLRQTGRYALAIKPFCSGSRSDPQLLHSLQDDDLTLEQINPFYFTEPLAPLAAARKRRRSIPLAKVLQHIQRLEKLCPHSTPDTQHLTLLIEGAGGLLVPLGEGYTWANLLQKLACEVIVVSANRLGTINHTLLTVRAVQAATSQAVRIVMMDFRSARYTTPDTRHNPNILSELLAPILLFQLPFLGSGPLRRAALKKSAKKLKKVLADILA